MERVKRCGKSAPPGEQSPGQGKPHTEQDQIGRNSRHSRGGNVPARRVKPSGRSLERRSNVPPRGMIVLLVFGRTDRIRLTGPAATYARRWKSILRAFHYSVAALQTAE